MKFLRFGENKKAELYIQRQFRINTSMIYHRWNRQRAQNMR